jgi:hypothetical protein
MGRGKRQGHEKCMTLKLPYHGSHSIVKRAEWQRYHQSVSGWETDNYLGVY